MRAKVIIFSTLGLSLLWMLHVSIAQGQGALQRERSLAAAEATEQSVVKNEQATDLGSAVGTTIRDAKKACKAAGKEGDELINCIKMRKQVGTKDGDGQK